ncbi:MAG: oligosaccharide repeat unit polymerase [Candidatus Omnitrophica bacterium]|nr:oligosaccharide repeat unit polymerase [Candidatus Omnitrophota bacterium]MCM8831370.1 oligosaccharide repeat unit polymerase [Candidatus Omnitrophota bacterium]
MDRKQYIFDIFFTFLVIFSPLFYGLLLPLPFSIFQISSLFLIFLFFIYLSTNTTIKILYPLYWWLLLLFLLVIIFQIIPLPYQILNLISPKTAQFYKNFIDDFGISKLYTLSIYKFNTQQELLKYICFFSIFFVTLNVFNKKKQFENLILILIFWSSLLCLYGIAKKYFILEKEETASFSVFYNRNHFSSYMVMVFSLALGYATYSKSKAKKFLFGFLAALICSSIFLSLSRAGSVVTVLAFLFFIFLTKRGWLIKKNSVWILVVCILITIIFISTAGFEPIRKRFLEFQKDFLNRITPSIDSLAIIKDFFLFGVGLGNFNYIFTSYSRHNFGRYIYHLLNEHLQLAIEVGIIGAFLYFLFLFLTFREIFIKLNKRADEFAKNIVAAGLAGLFGVILHGFFEFNFHIPAVSFLFWFLLGFIYKCVNTHFYR